MIIKRDNWNTFAKWIVMFLAQYLASSSWLDIRFRTVSKGAGVVQWLSHVWLFATPMDCSMPGLPVPHYLPEFAQVLVHWVSNATQPSHPVALLSFCFQSFSASGSFPVGRHFAPGGQSIGASASASVLPMSIQGWFPLRLTGLISFSITKKYFRDIPSTKYLWKKWWLN